jgi:hypothetical protein
MILDIDRIKKHLAAIDRVIPGQWLESITAILGVKDGHS